jgi:hypothetical protein
MSLSVSRCFSNHLGSFESLVAAGNGLLQYGG